MKSLKLFVLLLLVVHEKKYEKSPGIWKPINLTIIPGSTPDKDFELTTNNFKFYANKDGYKIKRRYGRSRGRR